MAMNGPLLKSTFYSGLLLQQGSFPVPVSPVMSTGASMLQQDFISFVGVLHGSTVPYYDNTGRIPRALSFDAIFDILPLIALFNVKREDLEISYGRYL